MYIKLKWALKFVAFFLEFLEFLFGASGWYISIKVADAIKSHFLYVELYHIWINKRSRWNVLRSRIFKTGTWKIRFLENINLFAFYSNQKLRESSPVGCYAGIITSDVFILLTISIYYNIHSKLLSYKS